MKIDFVDLKRQNRLYEKEYIRIFKKILHEATFIQGKPLDQFEQSFAQYCEKKYCVGLNSGTDALFFALLAYGIGPGDEVITAPNSYFSSAMVIVHTGAKVVFADIDPTTYTIDPEEIKKKITSRTRAIIPIHLYGQAADMDPIVKLARKHNCIIIEDACQAHGAYYKNNILPFTETGAFSFYPGKNLGSFGDGGALVTNNKRVANKVRLLRNDGSIIKYTHQLFGYKSRLDTLQAAILAVKLNYLPQWNIQRCKHAVTYKKLLNSISAIKLPIQASYTKHVYHIFLIETPQRDLLKRHLKKNGITTVIHYPIPIHLQAPFRKLGHKRGDFPITEKKAECILSLPLFPELKNEEIGFIVKKIKEFFELSNFLR